MPARQPAGARRLLSVLFADLVGFTTASGGDRARAGELLATVESLPAGLRPPFLDAYAHRFRARMDGDETGFRLAADGFREFTFPLWLAVTQLEHGAWLIARDRPTEAESLLAEAHELFERLEAAPWLARVEAVERAEARA